MTGIRESVREITLLNESRERREGREKGEKRDTNWIRMKSERRERERDEATEKENGIKWSFDFSELFSRCVSHQPNRRLHLSSYSSFSWSSLDPND